jgi:hypothetical protein
MIAEGMQETNKRLKRLENSIISRSDRIAVENTFSPLKLERGELTSHLLYMKKTKLRHGA